MASLSKNENVSSPYMQIDKNVIYYGGNSFICVDNISLITISPIPPSKAWIAALILGMFGYLMRDEYSRAARVFSVLIILAAIAWFAYIMYKNYNRGKNLAIGLNSGVTLYFNCHDVEFLNKVVCTLLESIKSKNKDTYAIRFDKCTIYDGVLNGAYLS